MVKKKMESISDDPKGKHYTEICEQAALVADSLHRWNGAKENTKELKSIYDDLSCNLLVMIQGGPDWQQKLEFGEEED